MGKRELQRAADSKQKSEVRDQTSEVRVKLISDLRLLTSVIDDFDHLPFTASPILPQDLNVPILLCNDFI